MTHRLARFQIDAKEPPAQHFLPLLLQTIPHVTGIYGPKKDTLPARMRYLAPPAASAFKGIANVVVLSDMFRSAESSLRARKERRGAQRPGYSGHNYGFSIDLAVTRSMRVQGLKSKAQLDEFMAHHGWYCHRRDHRRKFEEWHYNYFGSAYRQYVRPGDTRTSAGLERMITAWYGAWWQKMEAKDAQRALQRLGLYDGDLDGKFGPLSKTALEVFQRAWRLPVNSNLNVMTRRTLAYVSADRIPSKA